jgi:5-methylthioadenosine/S-adenosylhomocysteine deaminase
MFFFFRLSSEIFSSFAREIIILESDENDDENDKDGGKGSRSVVIHTGKVKSCPHLRITFIQRHAATAGDDGAAATVNDKKKKKKIYVAPHKINHRAIMSVLKDKMKVEVIVGMYSVGSMNSSIPVGSIVIPHDYYSPNDIISMTDEMSSHIVPGLSEPLRYLLIDALKKEGGLFQPLFPGGVYVQTRGPRFETKAEIRVLAQCGDIVGMTGAHEATLAKESGIPCAQICIVDNMAHGVISAIDGPKKLTLERFHRSQRENLVKAENSIRTAIMAIERAVKSCNPQTLKYLFDASSVIEEEDEELSPNKKGKVASAAGEDSISDNIIKIDLLVFARYIITVNEFDAVLENHAMAVKEGKIIAIVPADLAHQVYLATTTLNYPNSALSPGLVNAHTHTPMVFMRGFGDDMPLTEWLSTHIWPAEARCVSREFVRDGVMIAAAEMIRSGTTTFSDMYFFPDEAAAKVAEIGMRAFIGLIVIAFPSAWASSATEYVEKGTQIWENAGKNEDCLVKFTVGPHAPYSVKEADIVKVHALAVERDIPFHTHMHESAAEIVASLVGDVQSGYCHMSDQRCRPLANFERLGLLDQHSVFAHMTQLTDEEIELISKKKCSVVHCPSSNLKLASGFCPVHKLLKAGVNVCLGTDGAASNNTLDMIGEMRLAALLGAGVAGVAGAVPATAVFRMATVSIYFLFTPLKYVFINLVHRLMARKHLE